jgi:GntR family transcriptional regulator, transcriptional repressor for pyruvate dehydrogenase complex
MGNRRSEDDPPGGSVSDASDRFQPLERGLRLSDRLADQVLDSILSRGLRVGDRLPTEKELAEQFGVSRTVVREAMKVLAGKGMIDSRPRRGLRVAAPGAVAARQSMALYFRGHVEHDYRKVSEVRRMVEVEVAGLAAMRASDVEMDELRATCVRMEQVLDDTEMASKADLEFHRVLAGATNNELFLHMLDAISDSLMEIRRSTFQRRGRARIALAAHSEILECVAAHDPPGARNAMRAHLDDVEHAWEQVIAGDAGPGAVTAGSDPGGEGMPTHYEGFHGSEVLGNDDLNLLPSQTAAEVDDQVLGLVRHVGPVGGYLWRGGVSLAAYWRLKNAGSTALTARAATIGGSLIMVRPAIPSHAVAHSETTR